MKQILTTGRPNMIRLYLKKHPDWQPPLARLFALLASSVELQWEEKPKKDLLSLVKTIVRALEKEAGEIARHVEEAEHRVELERKKEKRRAALRRTEETKRRAIQAQKASLKELKKVIDDWGEVNRIEQFFSNAESQCSQP